LVKASVDAKDTRALLLSAAAKLFHENGYATVSLRQIAGEIGIKAGSIYYHFDSKEAILSEVLEEGTRLIAESTKKSVEAVPANAPFREKLTAALTGHLHGLLQVSNFASANIRIFGQVPERVRKRHRVARRAYRDYWQAILDEAQRKGEIRPNLDLSVWRLFVGSALNGTIDWYRADRGSFEKLVKQIAAIVCDGIVND
jgi:AcrR family transcriptional regulator